MAKSTVSPKTIIIVIALLIAGLAGFGYYNQAARISPEAKAPASSPERMEIEQALLAPKPNDIIIGDSNAIVTVVEYSSLSCPHCAHFHEDILPTLRKEFIDTGKIKLVMRHFPLNEPAMRGAQVVECAGKNGLKREDFLKALFSMQKQWAFGEDYLKNLSQIAKIGGMDSATLESCFADQDTETSLLASRQEAETKLQITATPTFFINGIKYEGEPSVEGFRQAFAKVGGGE